MRPDPKKIATLLRHEPTKVAPSAAPIGEILRRRGVVPALLAAQASLAVMVAVMTLTGAMVVDHFLPDHRGARDRHVRARDRGGRRGRPDRTDPAGGLLVMGFSVSGLLWAESVPATAAALFGLGLGWNLSYVAATADLADRTEPWERGRLLGFNDLLSGATGAGLTLLGGVVLTTVGVAALAIGASTLVVAPALWILRQGEAPYPAAQDGQFEISPDTATADQVRGVIHDRPAHNRHPSHPPPNHDTTDRTREIQREKWRCHG